MTTVTQAVAVRDAANSTTAMIEQYRSDFATVLPAHVKPDTWVRLAVGVFRQDERLRKAAQNNPAALMQALLTAARLGHEPGTEAYYLTPRWNKKIRGEEILGIEGYQGIVERIYRAGAVSSVILDVVRQNDRFTYVRGRDERPQHEVDWFGGDRGPILGAYAYAVMKDGATSQVVIIDQPKIDRAKAASGTADKDYSPWKSDEEAMVLKTAARQLRKWVPTSAEYREEMSRAHAAAADVAQKAGAPPLPGTVDEPAEDVDPVTGEMVIEGEIVGDGAPAQEPESWQ